MFLPHAEWLGRKYGIRSRDIVVERGTKKIGGQENMVDDAALTMMQQRRVAT
nr:A418 [uncultured bacterium]